MASYRVIQHQIPCQSIREYPRALANSQDDTLHLAVKQYVPIDNPDPQPGDVTIIGAHANGFPKELYEPLWDDMIRTSKDLGFRIRGIWMADVAHQGASSVVNENLIGNDPSWFDHSRDLLHMINMKRDEMPRPIVGIGHSMGGAQLVNLAYFHPRLFTSLVLIDPVIDIRDPNSQGSSSSVARLSTFRRDVWPSRAAAAESFKKSPFYQAWNPRVLDRWVQYGLRDLPTNLHPTPPQSTSTSTPQEPAVAVTLTTPVPQEVFTFLRPNYAGYGTTLPVYRSTHADLDPSFPNHTPFYRHEVPRIFQNLPALRPSALYIFGATSTTSTPAMNQAKLARTGVGVGATAGRVTAVTFEGVGHLVAMEAVERTANEAGKWIAAEMRRWRADQATWESQWRDGKTLREKQEVDAKWREMMGGPLERRTNLTTTTPSSSGKPKM